jgi:cytochrome c-type biogenesis protein CcmF
MGEIGRWSLLFAFIIIPYAMAAHLVSIKTGSLRWQKSAKNAVLILAGLTTLASASLVYLLVTDNFAYDYVAKYSSTDMVLFYKVTAFWGGNAGSLLLWFWMLTLYTAFVTWSKHKDSHLYIPWVSTILLGVSLFFALLLNVVEKPFALNPENTNEGNGLNPLLQNPGMAVHPVTLYLGYIGFAVSFAYGITALILKRVDATWLKVTRRWTLLSWLFLTIGIIYGSQWAYVELGWGGYWTWDPVENASFLPWLTATAYLHSAMVQEKKGMLKKWNITLVTITFLLTMFGTFLTRSGVLWSVHSFANGPIGAYFLGFIGVVLILFLYLYMSRSSELKADTQFESAVSKESSFLFNNLLLVASAFTIFWGTIYPVVSETVTGSKVMVGAPYFNRVNIPIFLLIVILMGIGPILAWKRSSITLIRKNLLIPFISALLIVGFLFAIGVEGWMSLISLASATFVFFIIFLEFVRAVIARGQVTGESPLRSFFMLFVKNRQRYGGYIAHIGVIFVVIGFTAAGSYSTDIQRSLVKGETVSIGGYSLEYRGLGEYTYDNKSSVYAEFLVNNGNQTLGVMRPEKVFYLNGNQPTTEVALVSTYKEDLYLMLNGWIEETGKAVVQVKIFPLISWVWFGGYVIVLGTFISLWPERRRRNQESVFSEKGSVVYENY